MNYSTGQKIRIGDKVIADGGSGIVVCDFDNEEYLPGYEYYDTQTELVGGGTLSSGVMIKTEHMGLVHYPEEDEDIQYVAA